MRKGNDSERPEFADIPRALGLLTRLALPPAASEGFGDRPAASAAWAYPVVGLVVGVLMVLFLRVLLWVGVPAGIAAMLSLGFTILITGAMHEDGLADCADGFWGGWTRERRLEIMKDSQIGSYGVLALVLSLVLRWQAVLWLIEADWLMALPAVEALSRALMVWVMQALPNARQRGLSAQTGVPGRRTALLAGGIGALMALLLGLTLAALIVGIAAMLLAMVVARNKIGGQTGDVLGAVQQVTAVAVLVTLAAQA